MKADPSVAAASRLPSRWAPWGMRGVGAAALFATGGIHLDLYVTGYRFIPTIGVLFILQVVAAMTLGIVVVAIPRRIAAIAGALFALSTLGGYLLSLWVGLFGFKEVRTTAGIVAGISRSAHSSCWEHWRRGPRQQPSAPKGSVIGFRSEWPESAGAQLRLRGSSSLWSSPSP